MDLFGGVAKVADNRRFESGEQVDEQAHKISKQQNERSFGDADTEQEQSRLLHFF